MTPALFLLLFHLFSAE
ncbi:hypothetical protein CGLO_18128 [Colletotrichum gloeosporioides Cg-14]|uniref:Uncharacterized protein n=1 Tax=Colletotrichum gloeosporioides (strain Cg-14) TaxID=1237896 RepID=T0KV79_COLGC|nr:hypothetical protein CGLO_18128 [Colletotrichum gloeosporioides Cg-14]